MWRNGQLSRNLLLAKTLILVYFTYSQQKKVEKKGKPVTIDLNHRHKRGQRTSRTAQKKWSTTTARNFRITAIEREERITLGKKSTTY
jgi:hypothetical protein